MTLTRNDFRFFHTLRVRWSEVDMQRIVFNAHYLTYLDTAMADYWRALAVPYEAAMVMLEGDLYVKKATVEYHASARYDEVLQVGLRCLRIGTSSITFQGAVFHGDVLLITAELIYVFADPASQKSRPVPEALRALLTGYEAGVPLIQTHTGSWESLGGRITPLRHRVFNLEQGIDANLMCDEEDHGAVHAVALNGLGQVVSSGRLLVHTTGTGKIGRMATEKALRGQGFARYVLHALMRASKDRGDAGILLHAQVSAVGFYLKEGFAPIGPEFEEAGIRHQSMEIRWTEQVVP
ncbi:MAG: YbgC/FadM family acyl-CoA thioesterase [Curvibacter sp.]|nr:MAG: YbgC/FadM family acyl-CoA thioesterase [Curvibacter sp.]